MRIHKRLLMALCPFIPVQLRRRARRHLTWIQARRDQIRANPEPLLRERGRQHFYEMCDRGFGGGVGESVVQVAGVRGYGGGYEHLGVLWEVAVFVPGVEEGEEGHGGVEDSRDVDMRCLGEFFWGGFQTMICEFLRGGRAA